MKASTRVFFSGLVFGMLYAFLGKPSGFDVLAVGVLSTFGVLYGMLVTAEGLMLMPKDQLNEFLKKRDELNKQRESLKPKDRI